MEGKTGIGKGGISAAIGIALAMSLAAYFLNPVTFPEAQYGIFLPSPESWRIPSLLSWFLNLFAITAVTAVLVGVNKTYNFIRTTEPALPAIFLIATTSTPWFTERLNTSVLLGLINVVCLGIIFGAYEKKNATQQMFTIGVLCGIGAMFQYAFLPMFFLYIVWALFMKILRLKEILAYIVGVFCPYWICLGLGILSFSDFHLPVPATFFESVTDTSELLMLMMATGVAAIIGFLTSLMNGMKLYAGNSKVNVMNLCISAMGLMAILCIFVDYENMTAYVVTLYIAMAVQIANICALWNIRQEWLVTALPALLFIAIFFGVIFL